MEDLEARIQTYLHSTPHWVEMHDLQERFGEEATAVVITMALDNKIRLRPHRHDNTIVKAIHTLDDYAYFREEGLLQ